jgi:hypothetical protein
MCVRKASFGTIGRAYLDIQAVLLVDLLHKLVHLRAFRIWMLPELSGNSMRVHDRIDYSARQSRDTLNREATGKRGMRGIRLGMTESGG